MNLMNFCILFFLISFLKNKTCASRSESGINNISIPVQAEAIYLGSAPDSMSVTDSNTFTQVLHVASIVVNDQPDPKSITSLSDTFVQPTNESSHSPLCKMCFNSCVVDSSCNQCPYCGSSSSIMRASRDILSIKSRLRNIKGTNWTILCGFMRGCFVSEFEFVLNSNVVLNALRTVWDEIFENVLKLCSPDQLSELLGLAFLDINRTFCATGHCPVSLLLVPGQPEAQDKFNVILTCPGILLDRKVKINGDEKFKHLIFHAIDANLFDPFMIILHASPKLDQLKVFHHTCRTPNRHQFFDYFFERDDQINIFKARSNFKLGQRDTSLTICLENENDYCARKLLYSPRLGSYDLLQIDNTNNKTIYHNFKKSYPLYSAMGLVLPEIPYLFVRVMLWRLLFFPIAIVVDVFTIIYASMLFAFATLTCILLCIYAIIKLISSCLRCCSHE